MEHSTVLVYFNVSKSAGKSLYSLLTFNPSTQFSNVNFVRGRPYSESSIILVLAGVM
jgi:hypothetical protein